MNTQNESALGFYAKLALVFMLAVALAEVAPELVNSILILILVGLIVSHWSKFAGLARILSTVAAGRSGSKEVVK